MGDYLDTLAEFVAETKYRDLSPDAVAAVRDVTLDTVGAIVGGSRLPENASLAQMMAERSGPATATIFGHGLKAEPMLATLVNATAGVALEMDEGNRFGGGHPSIHSLPGAVAVAEELGTDGQRLIESILVGYEVESRMGGATRLREDVHPHGIWGTISTAVAVAKLRGYTRDRIRAVINLAASMSPANSWTPTFEGATIRNLYPGRSGLQGILAVHVYECGYTGLDDGPTDVFSTILGNGLDTEAIVRGLGDGYRIQQGYFKFHACCRYNHPALDAVLTLRREEQFAPEEVEAVEVSTIPMPAGMVGDYPQNMLGAKFSVPYAVAAAIVRGTSDISTFYPETIGDERIREMAGRVRVEMDPKMALRRDGHPTALVSVRLGDGRVLSGMTTAIRGDAANPVPHGELVGKFLSLTTDVLGVDQAKAVVETVARLEQLPDVRKLTSLLGG